MGKIVGRGILDAPSVKITECAPLIELTAYGRNTIETIEFLNEKNDEITIEKYVAMPNHVHLLVVVDNLDSGASGKPHLSNGASGKPRPTNTIIPKLVSSIKRFTNKRAGFDMWQTSYHDHIIRDETDYHARWQYIGQNPARWAEDEYYKAGDFI